MKLIIYTFFLLSFPSSVFANEVLCNLNPARPASAVKLASQEDTVVVLRPISKEDSTIKKGVREITYKAHVQQAYKGIEPQNLDEDLTVVWLLYDGSVPLKLDNDYLMFLDKAKNNQFVAFVCNTVKLSDASASKAALDRLTVTK
jgi:hypothetical protein